MPRRVQIVRKAWEEYVFLTLLIVNIRQCLRVEVGILRQRSFQGGLKLR
jgi:hypothetical protein